jgi:hypothetical protein
MLKYLNKEESKLIFMQEFEISLFQFSNSMFTDKRQFSFKNILKRFAKRLWLNFTLNRGIVETRNNGISRNMAEYHRM